MWQLKEDYQSKNLASQPAALKYRLSAGYLQQEGFLKKNKIDDESIFERIEGTLK